MTRKNIIVFGLITALVVGAVAVPTVYPLCPIGLNQAQWELGVWVEEETHLNSGEVDLDVEVSLSGHTSRTTIQNVTVTFEDASGDVYHTVDIGTISGFTKETETVRLDHPPERIRLETGPIEKGNDDAEYWIHGVKRIDGEFEQFTQVHHKC